MIKKPIQHLWPAVTLITAASALLLFSDLDKRINSDRKSISVSVHTSSQSARPDAGRHYSIALSYFVPANIFEESIRGFKDGLADAGYIEGKNLTLTLQHCNADMGMLSQVTQNLAARNPNLFVTLSTPCLGNALTWVKETPIVFGVVSSPLAVKAGTTFSNHLPNVTGTVFQNPTEEAFKWARRLFPHATRIGTIYNPAEANSVAEVDALKHIFKKHGFELIAAPIMNSSEITQATQSVLQKNVDLFFAMGDNTVANGLPSIITICRNQRVPVIGEDGSMMGSGVLFSCGPSPYAEGRHTAEMAVRVLQGESPADLPFEPGIHFSLELDFEAARQLDIRIPDDVKQHLDYCHNLSANKNRPAKIAIVNLVENASLNDSIAGLKTGLQEHGLIPQKDYVIKSYCAQGDLSLLPQLFDSAAQDNPDVIVSVTSPALIAGVNRIKDIPFVFTVATAPQQLGLFKNGRQPNVTGVHDHPALGLLLDMARDANPALRTVGTIYDASQPQSLIAAQNLQSAGKERNMEIIEATASTISDLPLAARAILQRGADAIIISTDNLACTGFGAIHQVADAEDIPIYVTDMSLIRQGAAGGIGDEYADWGKQSAALVVKILTGLSPASLPIESTPNAKIVHPAAIEKMTTKSEPLEFRMVMYNEAHFAEECSKGLLAGLEKGGLVADQDYRLRILNAQGDISTLSSIMTSVKADQVDLLMVISTPCLQAALRQVGHETPIIFTGVGDAVRAGAGSSEMDHLPNVTGISVRSAFEKMAQLIKETRPHATAVGTLYTPAEINSELYRTWFAEELAKEDIELVAVPVTCSADTAQATATLCQNNIQAVAQIVDNTTRPGFAQIARKATDNNLPVYVFDSSQMDNGAVICIARDYYDAGLEAAEKALRVLNGTNPKDIPFSNTKSEKILINRTLADRFGLVVSDQLLSRSKCVPAAN